ncbi:hypothetical protein DH2020_015024 [Rehmannia glutinosa]|uniref:Catabolite repression protein creC n=1 Tax=Rehmannia glutinosa TaxID=99300 RepID=A0ABR0X1N5_REHGL
MNTAASNNTTPSSASASGTNAQAPGLKTYFKTPEGKYKLQYEKTYAGTPNYVHGKTVTQAVCKVQWKVTLAHLKDKPTQAPSQSSSGLGVTSGVRSAAARLLGGGNGSRALSFVGGNGGSKSVNGTNSRIGSLGTSSSNNVIGNSNPMAKGLTWCSMLDPIKTIQFSNSNPVCHAYDPDVKDGHDLLIGLSSGDVYSVSLRQQLQDAGKKLVGAQHYNKDGSVNNRQELTLFPGKLVSLVIFQNKDGSADNSFPVIKDPTQFSVSHARYSKNPVARWHICQGSINGIAFSTDGAYIATVGRDGYLQVFDYKNEELICGGKSYYGALLCCAWSMDGKYILAGGEDDLVQVWSMEDRKIVAWARGTTHGLVEWPSTHIGWLQIQMAQGKTLSIVLVQLGRTSFWFDIHSRICSYNLSGGAHRNLDETGFGESQPSNTDSFLSSSLKEKSSIPGKHVVSSNAA